MACDQNSIDMISVELIEKVCKVFAAKLKSAGLKSITNYTFQNSRYAKCAESCLLECEE